jgi:hypothetical protein
MEERESMEQQVLEEERRKNDQILRENIPGYNAEKMGNDVTHEQVADFFEKRENKKG